MRRKGTSRISIQNDTLDLSMSELTEIPVKDIALYPKVSRLDLSSNRITSINPTFCNNFRQIVELDLSQNELQSLSDNFGNLTNLVKLELYNNQLSSLPVSLGNLTKLRYLDLKNNRFPPTFLSITGECSDTKECQQCAKQIVSHMQHAQKRLEEEAINLKKAEEEREARRQVQDLDKAKRLKKAAKDKKSAAVLADRLERARQTQAGVTTSVVNSTTVTANVTLKTLTTTTVHVPNNKQSMLISTLIKGLLLTAILVTAAGAGILYLYTGGEFTKCKMSQALELMKRDASHLWDMIWWSVKSASTNTWHAGELSWWWLQTQAFPFFQSLWKMTRLASDDVREIAYNAFCHVTDHFGSPCAGDGRKITTTINSGKVLKF